MTKQPTIEGMRKAGHLAASVLNMIGRHVVPGITTQELDDICDEFTLENGGISACIGYRGYEKSTCISVNHVACHGIPSAKKLNEGDIVNIDVTVIVDGLHGDSSRMFYVGKTSIKAQRICELALGALWAGIEQVKPGNTTGDIGHAVGKYCADNNVNALNDYCGHEIGYMFHGDLQTLSFGEPGTGDVLKPGMFFTIEPILTLGKDATRVKKDGWTVVTKDRALTAQWEHTLVVTEDGYEILTL